MRYALSLLLIFVVDFSTQMAVYEPEVPEKYAEDLRLILDGIDGFPTGGSPGYLSVFGPQAFPILAAPTRAGQVVALGAAARYKKGRVAGLSHTSFVDPSNPPNNLAKEKFLCNLLTWLSYPKKPQNILIFPKRTNLALALESCDIKSTLIDVQDFLKITPEDLLQYDVIVASRLFDQNFPPSFEFYLENGGGLLIALTGWNDIKCCGSDFGGNYSANILTKQAGFIWTKHYNNYIKDSDGSYSASMEHLRNVHATDATNFIEMHWNDTDVETEFKKAAGSLQVVFTNANSEDVLSAAFYPTTRRFLQYPQPWNQTHPVTKRTDILQIEIFCIIAEFVFPELIPVHPSSASFPGEIIGNPSLPILETSITIDLNTDRWHSTGFYVPAGEVISVQADCVDCPISTKLDVQVGSHSDNLSGKPQLQRAAVIVHKKQLKFNEYLELSSAFGGLLYFVVGQPEDRNVTARIRGKFVRAPVYILGVTEEKDWLENIRYYPGRWAEFHCDTVILTVPSEIARNVDDPARLMKVWSQIGHSYAYLKGYPGYERQSPERMVQDVQISAGGMHAGYPIMGTLEGAPRATDYTEMTSIRAPWGHLHELGHNYQKYLSFEGTGESVGNVFVVHACDTVLNLTRRACSFNVDLQYGSTQERLQKYDAGGRSYEEWKKDPWLPLHYYLQLQGRFGWEAIRVGFWGHMNTWQSLEGLDRWVVVFSHVVGQSLVNFQDSWGLPLSLEAQEAVSFLPDCSLRFQELLAPNLVE